VERLRCSGNALREIVRGGFFQAFSNRATSKKDVSFTEDITQDTAGLHMVDFGEGTSTRVCLHEELLRMQFLVFQFCVQLENPSNEVKCELEKMRCSNIFGTESSYKRTPENEIRLGKKGTRQKEAGEPTKHIPVAR
jgi:hypothetical protein